MFYMNLDALPAGQQMYMVAIIATKDSTDYDEYDIVLPAGLGKDEVTEAVRADTEFVEMYGADAILGGAVNQSEGYVIWESMGKPE
jgi:hypothetical protein